MKVTTQQFGSGTIDTQFLGLSLQKAPQLLQEVFVERWADIAPLQSLFSGIFPESPTEEVLPSSLIRWMMQGLPLRHTYICASRGTFRTGSKDCELDVSDGWMQPGATVRLEDGSLLQITTAKSLAAGKGATYGVQVVSNNPDTVIDSLWLEKGKALNFEYSVHPEASETGHPIQYGTGNQYMNALTTVRTKASITGDAMAEALVLDTMLKDQKSGEVMGRYRGFLPNVISNMGRNMLSEHIARVERMLVRGVANFNPQTGFIYNTTAEGQDVLQGDGLLSQFNSAFDGHYYPTDNLTSILSTINRALAYIAYHSRQDKLDWIVMGGAGSKIVWNYVMQDYLNKSNMRVIINADKLPTTIQQLDIQQYDTPHGTVKFVPTQVFNDPEVKTREIVFQGYKYPAESFDFYFMPVQRLASGKTNIRIYAKGKSANGQTINRSLVFAHIAGMTGMLAGKISSNQKAQMETAAYMAATGRDAEQYEVLSQKGLIITNPTECAVVRCMR